MKQFLKKLSRWFWYLLWYSLAISIILVAAVFGVVRLMLPLIGDYNQDIEQYAEQYAGRPIKIMSLDAEWHGFSPSLVLNNVRLLSKDGKETLLHVSRVRLDFNLIDTARTKQVQFKRFLLSGTNLSLVRLPSGEFSLSGFESNAVEPPTQGEDSGSVIDWLLAQGEISLHARNFIFQDQLKGKRFYYSNLSVRLRNEANRHMIDGSVAFDKKSKKEFSFAADITGDVLSNSDWSGKVYVRGKNLDVTKITGPLDYQDKRIAVGESSFELWTDWRQAALTAVQGDISLGNFKVNSKAKQDPTDKALNEPARSKIPTVAKKLYSPIVHFRQLNARFVWDKYQDGWKADLDKVQIINGRESWPQSQLSIHYFTDSQDKKIINVKSSFVRLGNITSILGLLPEESKKYTDIFDKYKPKGDVENSQLNWMELNNTFELAARLKNVSINQHEDIPGVTGLTGTLQISNRTGSFEFDTERSSLDLPKIFRNEILFDRLQGTVNWQSNETGVTISSRDLQLATPYFRSAAVVDVAIPASGASPFLSVIAKFNKARVSKASLYYPYSIMSKGALSWLDKAFVRGEINAGGAIVYGPIDEFPFIKGQGVFDVRFNADNVTLDYSEGWPKLYNADADVVFRGNSLSVSSRQAKIFDSDVTNIKAFIPDMGADVMKLDIDGTISGKTQNKLKYLLTAPQLKAKYERGLSDLRTTGNSDLDLDMTLSIGNDVDANIKGNLELKNNTLELVQIPGLMDSINGKVSFDNSVFKGEGIKANLLAQAVDVNVKTLKKGEQEIVEYKAVGKFNAKSIAKSQFPLLHDMVDGDSHWAVRFLVPEANQDPQLIVQSNLKGISLNLPVPFKKEKTDSRRLKVATTFRSAEKAMMKISYASNFEGILEKNYTKDLWLTRGEVRFGGGPAVLPSSAGLRIAGDIDYLSYDVWENLINQLIELNERENPSAIKPVTNADGSDPYFTLVNSVDLHAKNFEIFGQKATNARIKMENKRSWLAVKIDSQKFSGNIKVPDDLDNKPIALDMERLIIEPEEESGGRIDPREIPSLKLNSRSVVYGNKKLGQVAVETSKQVNGMLVQQLILKPRATVIKGHGAWFIDNEEQKANLELVIESKDFGKTMKDLGYVDTIANGVGTVNVVLNWPSSLLEPDRFHMGGKVSLHMENGRILDIEPGGAARLMGLFSLQTLPRRLMLDFSDLFAKGLKFDVIKGDFNIEQGDAYTSNLQLVGPNANVLLKGRIGLGTEDYDQKVKITPHITDTTILLSIISSQPLLFLFQQLLKQDIEAATSFEYTLSGKWDNYKLEPILKVPPPETEQADDF